MKITIKTGSIDYLLIRTLLLVASIVFVCDIVNLDFIISPFFYFSFFLVWLLFFLSLRINYVKTDLLALIIVIMALCSFVIDCLINSAVLSFDYLKKIIIFCSSVFFIQYCSKTKLPFDIVTFAHSISKLLSISIIAVFLIKRNSLYYIFGRQSQYLFFNMTNPNIAGIFILAISVVLISTALFLGERKRLFFSIVLFAALGYLMILTKCRTALLAVSFFIVSCLVKIKNYSSAKRFIILLSILPIIFATLYFAIERTGVLNNTFSIFSSPGKGFDSRKEVWLVAFNAIKENFIIGSYYIISEGTGISQMHNIHVDVWASYGIIPAILLTDWLIQILSTYAKNVLISINNKRFFVFGFCSALVVGLGEALLFSGGLTYYIFVGILLILANVDTHGDEIQK